MIINKTLNDETQKQLLCYLADTERLLSNVASKLSGKPKSSTIFAMPDLGLAHNVTRMMGGFFTGGFYSWDTEIPFVPVDATVNVCGTAVYKLRRSISCEEFEQYVNHVIKNDHTYQWNYANGNHFISLAYSKGNYHLEKGYYMVVHASACEFKEELYPISGNWYFPQIQTEYLPNSSRYLRYISGKAAEIFYGKAKELVSFNENRNRYFCQKVLGDLLEKELLNTNHYGMPTQNSIAIGCHWNTHLTTLLTAPGKNIFLVIPKENYFPHGFGLCLPEDSSFVLQQSDLQIGSKHFSLGDSIHIGTDGINRYSETIPLDKQICSILEHCPGKIAGELEQISSYSNIGFKIWKENTI